MQPSPMSNSPDILKSGDSVLSLHPHARSSETFGKTQTAVSYRRHDFGCWLVRGTKRASVLFCFFYTDISRRVNISRAETRTQSKRCFIKILEIPFLLPPSPDCAESLAGALECLKSTTATLTPVDNTLGL